MKLEKINQKHFDEYLSMSKDFLNSDAVLYKYSDKNIIDTYNQIINGSSLCDGYVLLDGNEILGYTQVSFSWNNDSGGKVLWFEEIYIKAQHRGRGLGRFIIDGIYEMFRDDCKIFRLEVELENEGAIKLYKKLGFKERAYLQYSKDSDS